MKNITEFINENLIVTEIGKKTVNVDWVDGGKKIASKWKSIPSELKTILEDDVYGEIESFYTNTPKKRNVTSMCSIIVKLNLDSDPIYKKLYSLYNKVGMSHWMIGYPMQICSGDISGISTSREGGSDRTKVKMNEHFYNSWRKPEKSSSNGYNNLPGEVIDEYRDKFMDCISGAEVVVSKDKVRNFRANAMIPRYNVIYNAIYDKSKVQKLMDEINEKIESDELDKYVKSLAATSKAIDQYYSSKRSGDYTGD